MINHLRQTN